MNGSDMKAWRQSAGLNQSAIAELIGLKVRAYQDLEKSGEELPLRHQQALERVSLRHAVSVGYIGLALPAVRRDALDYAALVRGEKAAT